MSQLYYPTTANAVQKTLGAELLTGVTAAATLNNITSIQNKAGVFVVDRVDSNGVATPNKREYISFSGTSGSTVVTLTRGLAGSTDQDHAVGAIVEFVGDVVQQQAIIDGLLKVVDTSGNLNKASADDVATGTDDTKIVTPLSAASLANDSLHRQALINGNFDVWQRGTSIAMAAGSAYGPDRYEIYRSAYATGATVSRQTASLDGSTYSCRVQRDSGNSGTGALFLVQPLETINSVKLRGVKLTLSFYAKKGANYSATSDVMVASIQTGTGTDQKYSLGWTSQATAGTSNVTLTTSWQKFTVTTSAVIANTVNQVAVSFSFTPTGTASTNDWFEIAQVQLCAGEVALPFQPKSCEEELRSCMRYYEKQTAGNAYTNFGTGIAYSTSAVNITVNYYPKRTTPTCAISNLVLIGAGGTTVTYSAIYAGQSTAGLDLTVAGTPLTVNACYVLRANNNTAAYIEYPAEL